MAVSGGFERAIVVDLAMVIRGICYYEILTEWSNVLAYPSSSWTVNKAIESTQSGYLMPHETS